jgi:hypothetical protein
MDKVNHNIKCGVKTCDYHAGEGRNFCTRQSIHVNCCDTDAPQNSGCTQCSSFCAAKE